MKNSITMTVAAARGFLKIAPKNEARYYLNGVYFDFEKGRVVATDGHQLLAGHFSHESTEPSSAIVPRDALEAIAKGGRVSDDITVSFDGDMLTLERPRHPTMMAHPIDGKFPDYERVIPRDLSGDLANYNPRYLLNCADALRGICAFSRDSSPVLIHNGNSPGIMAYAGQEYSAIAVIMPIRVKPEHKPDVERFFSEPEKKSKAA